MIRLIDPNVGVIAHPEMSRSPLGHDLCRRKALEGEVEELLYILRTHHTVKVVRDHLVC